jgi:spermine/spermidine synthase
MMTPAAAPVRAGVGTFAGLFLVTLATLTYQLLLTRTFSVTMYYHFAFVAISVTMFGMAVGAIAVYLRPRLFVPERVARHLAIGSVLFAITIVLSYLTHLAIPFVIEPSVVSVYALGLTYAALSVPFVMSGIVVSLALTRFPKQVGPLYAADLTGAALGCLVVGPLLRLADAPTAVLASAGVASVAAVLFAAEPSANGLTVSSRVRRVCVTLTGLLIVATMANGLAARRNAGWLRLMWVKGQYEARPLVERWNSFSRIRVIGDPNRVIKPSGWGLSAALPADKRARELHLDIDSYAGTELTAYNGDPETVSHLKYDVTNVAHYLRPNSRVVVVGTGGGRDVLSALVFNQREVTGVEINESIIDLVNRRFGDFTGHLDRDPRVRFVNDEARSYITRLNDRVDLIQISLIDTWAATASGAFVLTENSLYTTNAWRTFLDHLAPRGILSVSRWYYANRPGEVYRLATLASTVLRQRGVTRPGDHYAIVRARPATAGNGPDGVGTMLLSRDPLSVQDLDALEAVASRLQFEIVQSPRYSADDTFAAIASGSRLADAIAAHPLNIAAPTDDTPFFFHMLRLRDVFNTARWHDQGIVRFNMTAVGILGVLMVTVTVLTAACIVLPLVVARSRHLAGSKDPALHQRGDAPGCRAGSLDPAGNRATIAPHLLYFGAIGFGFMLVEISQVQRLAIFLGHPVYSLSVVLFSLLLSSGIGSLATSRLSDNSTASTRVLLLLVIVLVAFGSSTPLVVRYFDAVSIAVRIVVAVAILLPIGFFMGMAFPIGMRRALAEAPSIAPWLWGVNGAASVCASVLVVVIALGAGISAAFWVGAAFYLIALFALLTKRSQEG